jgi:hypothetical protein
MKTWLTTIALASLVLVGAASAAIRTGDEFLAQVQQQVQDGKMSSEQALLTKFQYAFDRESLSAEFRPEGVAPLKCGTPLIVEFMQVRDQLPADIRSTIEGYLVERDDPSRVVYYPPLGMFSISYVTTGVDAVPLADTNANGVPDYVERVGEYFDYSWTTEVTNLGFGTPPHSPYFSVTIKNLSGIYGVTYAQGGGSTRIEIENDFVGFPPNDDPDGDVLGAAKVTACHEFKHSTQYVVSNWSEGGWVEVDATWCEEIVYPAANDYHNYLSSGSPISNPAFPLDDGGTGSYEDCVWQLYMSEHWDVQMIVNLWLYRRTHQAEPMLTSYDTILRTYGTSIADCWPLFTTWNYATGARNESGFGYHDAPDYPTGSAQRQMTSYPGTYSGTGVQHLAANFIRCLSLTQAGKYAQVTFNGANTATTMSLTAFVRRVGPGYEFYAFDLDASNDGVFILPPDLVDVYEIGFIIGNGAMSSAAQSYTITVERVDGQSTPVGEGVTQLFQITGNHPNPFNPATTIAFAVDRDGPVAMDLYDLRGQRIRNLVTENLTAGPHEVRWDGLDDSGRQMPSGTYLARLSSNGAMTTHKLVLAK